MSFGRGGGGGGRREGEIPRDLAPRGEIPRDLAPWRAKLRGGGESLGTPRNLVELTFNEYHCIKGGTSSFRYGIRHMGWFGVFDPPMFLLYFSCF